MSAVVERLGWMLIHSLWEDVVIWLLLKTALIGLQKKSAQARYLAACVALVAMAVLPWLTFGSMDLSARLQTAAASSLPAFVPAETKSALSVAPAETPSAPVTPPADSWGNGKDSVSRENLLNAVLPWLVAGWAVGVALFAVRLCISWRYLRRLAVLPLTQLSVEWQRRLDELCLTAGVRVFVRAGETAAVLAPIVIGWLRPVILLPLGVLAQLPAEQVEAILFHELAHIRRHDFLVNLLQSGVETLFFYHPAVRSVSHQMREEREHICDDLSVAWCRNPVAYAEALTTFEEYRRQSLALALTGEGDLLARIRRIILGVEPRQRTASLFAVAGFLAIGAYLASMFLVPLLAAELMTDQERVAKIEALQPPPNPANSFAPSENVFVSGTLKTEDGQPLPKSLFEAAPSGILKQSEAKITSSRFGNWSAGGLTLEDPRTHSYHGNTQTGRIELGVWAEGYAPLRKTLLQAQGGEVKADLTLKRGFPARVQIIGPNGQPLAGVTLTATSASSRVDEPLETSMPPVESDATGMVSFGNVEADSEIHLNVFKPGWQMANETVSQWTSQTPFVCKLEPAQSTSGVVMDQATHRPIAGAEIILAARRGAGDSYVTFAPTNGQVLGHSDGNGRFNLESLAQNPGYYIYIQAAGYPTQSFPIFYGQQNRVCELPHGLHLRGKILDPKGLLKSKKYYHPIELQLFSDLQATPFNGYGREKRLTLPKLGPEIPFDFEDVPPGRTGLGFAIFGLEDYRYDLNLQKDVDDYVIHFDAKPPAGSGNNSDPRPLRKLLISFKTDSGALPTGVLDATYLSTSGEERWSTPKVATIANGEASVSLPVPTKVGLCADHLVGYWFAPENFDLPKGTEVFPRTITAVRAGVIHGNVSFSPAFANQFLSVSPVVIKPPPGMTITDLTSGSPNSLSPKNDFVTQPLPFGGIYAVILNAGPSFFISAPAMVDAEHPLVVRDLDLKLPAGTLKGQFVDEANKPIPYQEVMLTYHPNENDAFMSHSATTDADGSFTLSGLNFEVPGNYEVQLYGDDWKKTTIRIDAHTPQPVIIALQPKAK